MRTWHDPVDVSVPPELAASIGGHPLVVETLVRRGFTDSASVRTFLDPAAYVPAPPADLPGMQAAADRLERAIRRGEAICVWGDFDVDGQTATTLLVSALRALGAEVTFHIPVRERESHGVNLPVLTQILDGGAELILTCDTGIAAHEALAYAQKRGIDVIVSDHHDLPPSLPPAFAILNPKLLPENHPLSALPGVGVAYKLAEELYRRSGDTTACETFLDLVALGIVADVALQVGDVRYLLQRGLEVLRHTQRQGLQVMMEQAGLNPTWLTEEHIGFLLGPRLNALGRLGDANPVVEFLTTQDLGRARILALQLEGLNERRKLLTNQVFRGALAQIEADPSLLNQAVLVLANPAWPGGVIGIVASRLVERYNKPAILIAAPPGELARGSARSVEGLNITAAIADQKDLLVGFGGHPMAAGLSMEPENIPDFRRALSRTVSKMGGKIPEKRLEIDGYLDLKELSLDLVSDLERLAPFGPGNPPLVLASRGLQLVSHTHVGREEEHLLLTVEDSQGTAQRVIWWQGAGWPLPEGHFDLAYSLRASTFRGQRDIQVEWVDARIVEPSAHPVEVEKRVIQIIDFRQEAYPLPILQRLQAEETLQTWCEGAGKEKLGGRDRYALEPSQALAIWTIPPGWSELRAALEKTLPEKVYLFGIDPKMDHPQEFLERLSGLIKYALSAAQGRVLLPSLAAATAQSEAAVWTGLAWLAARGYVRILEQKEDELSLAAGEGNSSPELAQAEARLKAILEETGAFRSYFARARKDMLIQFD